MTVLYCTSVVCFGCKGSLTLTSTNESLAVLGIAQVVLGGVVLIWAGWHYDDLHAPLRRGQSPVHPGAARIVGLTTIVFIGAALIITVATVAF